MVGGIRLILNLRCLQLEWRQMFKQVLNALPVRIKASDFTYILLLVYPGFAIGKCSLPLRRSIITLAVKHKMLAAVGGIKIAINQYTVSRSATQYYLV
jgi:hypothetical protein